MSERDTKFAGFAKALWEELRDEDCTAAYYYPAPVFRDDALAIIARRAYDLVTHAFEAVNPIALQSTLDEEEVTRTIPDMPELPEEEKQ